MNAVDRFSNTLARYRQQAQPMPQVAYPQPAYPQPVQSIQPQPAQPRNDVERALDKVAEVTPVLSRLAALVNRVQNPAPAVASVQPYPAYPGYPATPPIAPPSGPIGQSLQRLGQAVGSQDVDRFVRQAAPVIDEALPLIEDIVNLASGKSRTPAPANPYQPYVAANQPPTLTQQVAPIVEGVTSLAAGVSSMVKAFEGLFKR